eukprot:gnl/Trimastix_PCT/3440.p1 GENE.gnl/Trimastix_PCT/3440~~gnl/Trimastix_PCT/3440.p1  ORF type:complete len:367 (-),score=47.14 gnl/Trimastix_PCT/3440:36-1055(-)
MFEPALDSFPIEAIKAGIRVDGRRPFDIRNIEIVFPHQEKTGHAEVRYGKTRVLCMVTGEIRDPFPERPTEGILSFGFRFSPLASPKFEAGRRPSDRCVEISRVVERGIRETRAINMESLCILAGRKVWHIRVDVTIADDDGNLTDVASCAVMAALMHFRRPLVSTADGQVRMFPVTEREPVPLTIHHVPLCMSFALFSQGCIAVLDPTAEEEALRDGSLTLTLNSRNYLCAVQKAGGVPLSPTKIFDLTAIAQKRMTAVNRHLLRAVKASSTEVGWTFSSHLPSAPSQVPAPTRTPAALTPTDTDSTSQLSSTSSMSASADDDTTKASSNLQKKRPRG